MLGFHAGGPVWRPARRGPAPLVEFGELLDRCYLSSAGNPVAPPGSSALRARVDVLPAADEPAGLLEPGQVRVQRAAWLAGRLHQLKAVPRSLRILKKD